MNFLKQVTAEFNVITWPSNKEVWITTFSVIVLAVITAYYLGLFDLIFSRGLQELI